ncbi:hypothetical protein [Amycolatopsis sp. NPDC051903]|uniref:hypothetical protein n=1 Tax=Amycolatopsis sp. NPDC051903 TaxID=3363936 RepID=UPI0037A12EDA
MGWHIDDEGNVFDDDGNLISEDEEDEDMTETPMFTPEQRRLFRHWAFSEGLDRAMYQVQTFTSREMAEALRDDLGEQVPLDRLQKA